MTKSAYEQSALLSNLSVVWNEILKNIKTTLAYPSIFIFWAIFPIFWFIPFILQGQAFVGGLESASFEQVTGTADYIPFIVIGAVFNSYVNTLLYGMGENIRRQDLRANRKSHKRKHIKHNLRHQPIYHLCAHIRNDHNL
jgi:hypothetical protein